MGASSSCLARARETLEAPSPTLAAAFGSSPAASGPDHRRLWATWERPFAQRGALVGVAVEPRECHVWTLRDGKLWRLRIYATKSEALEAVGLSEQDVHADS